MAGDITEEFQVEISNTVVSSNFTPSNIAYDLSIANMAFIMDVNKDNPHIRQTAQYKRDQFDNAPDPGEQSLSGWWLRSQMSFHNGAGIRYYEPGTDAAHVTHRFYDSRGIDVWTPGKATLHKTVFHSYTGTYGIHACTANDGTNDVLVSGEHAGELKKITFNGTSTATTSSYSLFSGHSSNPVFSVTSDGSRYFAICDKAIHRGYVDGSGSDEVIYNVGSTALTNGIIKYVKGYLLAGHDTYLAQINPEKSNNPNHSSSSDLPSGTGGNFINHLSKDWKWVDITSGATMVYAAGRNSSRSEIWAIPYSDTTVNLSLPDAYVVAELPFGEYVNNIYYYLGYLVIATSKGVRIGVINQGAYQSGHIEYGPLLFDSEKDCNGIVANDRFVWVSTSVKNGTIYNAILVRIDLSTPFDDGTFPYAYDLQYESDESSYGKEVYYIGNRLHLVIDEGASAGEIQTEHTTNYRDSGWIETGYVRYGTVQPKFFKYVDVRGNIPNSNSIGIKTIDHDSNAYDIVQLTGSDINSTVKLSSPATKQESLALRFTLTNYTDKTVTPILNSYQLKSVPAVNRQRLIQYPLSCYDRETDRYNVQFGYKGRAHEIIQAFEIMESESAFVQVNDYRTGERYEGLIEDVKFVNQSSADKNESGYGGTLIVTIRKM